MKVGKFVACIFAHEFKANWTCNHFLNSDQDPFFGNYVSSCLNKLCSPEMPSYTYIQLIRFTPIPPYPFRTKQTFILMHLISVVIQ